MINKTILYLHFQCLEGGKVELWDLEVGEGICSTRNTDDDAVTCVKVRYSIRLVSFLSKKSFVSLIWKTAILFFIAVLVIIHYLVSCG